MKIPCQNYLTKKSLVPSGSLPLGIGPYLTSLSLKDSVTTRSQKNWVYPWGLRNPTWLKRESNCRKYYSNKTKSCGKMWSDDIHKKMDDAGESHYPAYDEKAWEKMSSLLDKHLPEKKKKRRFIFLLLPLVL